MIPSRGIHALRARIPRHTLIQQCRHLSSTPRPSLRSPLSQSAGRTPRATAPAAISLLNFASIRHASSESSAQYVPPPSEFPNLDTINLDNLDPITSATAHLPTETGYLHSLGIDYGWGPTTCVQWVLENIYVHTGLPWWATILSTALLLRAAAFPLFLRSSDSMARQAALGTVLKPYSEAITAAQKSGDSAAVLNAMRQKSAIHKRAGISTSAQLIPVVVQGVIGFCGFRLMKAMVALPVPGLMDGGFLWLHDLTLSDGYLILPLAMAGTMHLMARFGGESGTSQLPPQMKKVMLYVMPGLIMLFTAWQPGAVCLWFCGSGVIGLAQGQLLQRASVRRFFNLAPMYKPKPGEEPQNPFTAYLEKMSGKNSTPTPSAGPARGTGQKPGVAYMNPVYQAPNVQRSGGKTIDARLVSRTDAASGDMVQPGQKRATGKGGMFSGIKDSVDAAKSRMEAMTTPSSEKMREDEKAAFKKRAEAYEKRAKERGR
ncbi:uncharacterized protein RCC_07845 [Ramularia collo-cygni]|uniref:Membrane insertase YidC/Oxa/ALB C-terminal domain-containing protein n=1 Tax=Ramularia collo-cygni TaxID=112498 RepID=A0A2D3VDT5_9PEZI|nr:uncharacterized protein RCC_07845 [Ramularia collo-cygni]CZT21976.1 uncharacterized protein RCC_07845 [Ramularia collo-cygni]